MNSIEVCISPALFEYKTTNENYLVAIVDVLRATTAFCAAFDSGVESVIPVSGLVELLEYKKKGYLTAAERNGEKVDFADFGNSPTVFLQNSLTGKDLAYSTTNGTQAIEMAKSSGSIAIASFSNLTAVCNWISEQQKNVIILCSGWKNTFSLEDTLCAGAIVEKLLASGKFISADDASLGAQTIWMDAKKNLRETVKTGSHFQRLKSIGLAEDLEYCFLLDTTSVVPVWDGFKLIRTTRIQS
jgi:2-phosphosulfolactate phosphatase